jgi:putative sterol carrier protein
MPKIEIQELISILQNSFVPANAQGVNMSVQLDLTGEGGGQWFMVIKDQKCQVESGIYPNPRASLSLDKVDLFQLLSGELNPMMAFFSGRVHISGDRSAVMKLASLFHIDQETIDRFRN